MAPPARTAAKPAAGSIASQLTPATIGAAVVLMVLALLALYYLLLYSPLSDSMAREASRGRTIAGNLRRARTDERSYNDDVAELGRLRSHARDLQGILPNDADIPGFMRSINTLAESSGLQIMLIEPAEEHVEQYYVRVPVRLQVSGTYLALARFFRAVAALPRVINMENISFDTPTEHDGQVTLHARVLATTFRALNESEQAAQRTPPPRGHR